MVSDNAARRQAQSNTRAPQPQQQPAQPAQQPARQPVDEVAGRGTLSAGSPSAIVLSAPPGVLLFPAGSSAVGLGFDFSTLASSIPSPGPPATIAGRLTLDLSRYALNRRDKDVATISLFYVPDTLRDCIPFVAKSTSTRRIPGNNAVYCCALEIGLEALKSPPCNALLDEYLTLKERSVSGRHRGNHHETTVRKAFESPTHDTPREKGKVIVPVYRKLKDDLASFTGAYNLNETTAGYLCLLASLGKEPAIAERTRARMRSQLGMWWEDLYLKTAGLRLRIETTEGWQHGTAKPWETDDGSETAEGDGAE